MNEKTKAAPGLCPFCARPMHSGFIRSRDQLSWTGDDGERRKLDSHGILLFKISADYCPACKKVVIDAG